MASTKFNLLDFPDENSPDLGNLKVVRSYRNKHFRGRVVCSDALRFLRTLACGSASLVFIDPPFNLGKVYSDDHPRIDRRSPTDYKDWLEAVLCEAERVLCAGGTLYVYHIPLWAMRVGVLLEDLGLQLRHWIAISMKNGFARGLRLYPAHYALLMFTKGEPLFFNRPRLKPKLCRHCGKYIKDYGGYLPIVKEKGLNLSDIWDDLSPVRHKSRKYRTANELPAKMMDRILSISGHPEAVFVDPFVGSGASALAAASMGMRLEVCDIIRANCEIVCDRLSELYNGLRRK